MGGRVRKQGARLGRSGPIWLAGARVGSDPLGQRPQRETCEAPGSPCPSRNNRRAGLVTFFSLPYHAAFADPALVEAARLY